MGWKKLGGLIDDIDGEDCDEVKVTLLSHIKRIGGTSEILGWCGH